MRCWFCGDAARAGDALQAGLHRDVRDTFVVIGVYTRWKAIWVDVPRCGRCRLGHQVEQVVFYVLAGSAVITGMLLIAWLGSVLSGDVWEDQWQVALPVVWVSGWLALWLGIKRHWFGVRWLAPKPQRYAREYPSVVELLEDGWKFRGRPH